MKALILAAGRGTRLGALTSDCPKPLLDLAGRPIIEWIIGSLRDAGVGEFVIVTGHLAERMESHLGDGSGLGITIQFLRQENPRGTGEAVNLARDLLRDGPFVMTYGDIVISPENCGAILRDFEEHPCDLLIGLNWVEDPTAGGAVYVDGDLRVMEFIEKPPPGTSTTHWNSAGLMVMTPAIFEHTAVLSPSARGELEISDAFQGMIEAGCTLRGFPLRGFWSDIGTPGDLQRTREVFGGASQSDH
ncbi:NTP transferase domain-containing protein [Candidatus Sumerlaeota bacterium]|nr:NTP transferase domain-containing protein [Candidatus Sumerlaeota bacterium]